MYKTVTYYNLQVIIGFAVTVVKDLVDFTLISRPIFSQALFNSRLKPNEINVFIEEVLYYYNVT